MKVVISVIQRHIDAARAARVELEKYYNDADNTVPRPPKMWSSCCPIAQALYEMTGHVDSVTNRIVVLRDKIYVPALGSARLHEDSDAAKFILTVDRALLSKHTIELKPVMFEVDFVLAPERAATI